MPGLTKLEAKTPGAAARGAPPRCGPLYFFLSKPAEIWYNGANTIKEGFAMKAVITVIGKDTVGAPYMAAAHMNGGNNNFIGRQTIH